MVLLAEGGSVRRIARITAEVRRAVAARTNGLCVYCGRRAGCLDHIVPVELGGPDDIDNLVAACRPCNSSKGHDQLPDARHRMALLILGWPPLSPAVLMWVRSRGADLAAYDRFQFAFETRNTRGMLEVRRLVQSRS